MSHHHTFSVCGHTMAALSFNREKSGPPIIFMHGITASITFWTLGQTPYISDNFRWYSLSLPGHFPAAFSPYYTDEDLSADSLAEVQMAAIRHLVGDERFILIGHSTGGFSALNIASRWPEKVIALASISGFVQGRWLGLLARLQDMARGGGLSRAMFRAAIWLAGQHPYFFRLTSYPLFHDVRALKRTVPVDDYLAAVRHNRRHLRGRDMLPYFARMPEIDISERLANINCPVLLMAGAEDPAVPDAQAQLVAERVPEAELHIFPAVGHLPMLEAGETYHAALSDWLARVVRR